MYVYTETGKLLERIIYRDEAKSWGKPVAMSEDAKFLIFRTSDKSPIIHLVEVSIDGLHHARKVNIKEHLDTYLFKAKIDQMEDYQLA